MQTAYINITIGNGKKLNKELLWTSWKASSSVQFYLQDAYIVVAIELMGTRV